MANQPYQHFKTAIANKLIANKIFNAEWFDSQEKRLQMFWECGETPETAYEVIGCIAEAKFSSSVYRPITKRSLTSAGCEFA